jgi:LPS sulfotransferase NodH
MAEVFLRPVIILSAPRSGSTLLFETLARARGLWTIGGESHALIETIPALRPFANGEHSNLLSGHHATPGIIAELRYRFLQQARNRDGRAYGGAGRIRLLEKTPKNVLRIPFLLKIFPDALFVYLYRNPRQNVSSIMEAWRSGRFVTYRELPDWEGTWSLLLPPDWQTLKGCPLEEVAAFQWRQANAFALQGLRYLEQDRWCAVSYDDLVTEPRATVKRLCNFAGVPFDRGLGDSLAGGLPLSRYTVSRPEPGKWRKNERELARVLPGLAVLDDQIRAVVDQSRKARHPAISEQEFQATLGRPCGVGDGQGSTGRNRPCPCGSGKKFKYCHGQIQ